MTRVSNRKNVMKKKKRLILRIMLILVSVILVSSAVVAYQIKSNIDKMIIPKTETDLIVESNKDPAHGPDQAKEDEDFYVFVMGLDFRENHNVLLTDSLMVLHVIPKEATIKLLSIPRDLLVQNTNGKIVKINSLFSEGRLLTKQKAEKDPSMLTGDTVQLGSYKLDKAVLSGSMANTRNKIEELLDVKIDHTVLVNFNTVTSLVDEVGGIQIDVKRSMKYRPTNLYLEPGLQILNGEDALGYARFREDDRGPRFFASDFERGKQQQEVVKALANEILSWKNLTKVLRLSKIVSENVQTDMEYSDMYSMITKYYDVFNGDSFISLPFPEHYSSDGNVIIPNDALNTLQNSLKQVETHTPASEVEQSAKEVQNDK